MKHEKLYFSEQDFEHEKYIEGEKKAVSYEEYLKRKNEKK